MGVFQGLCLWVCLEDNEVHITRALYLSIPTILFPILIPHSTHIHTMLFLKEHHGDHKLPQYLPNFLRLHHRQMQQQQKQALITFYISLIIILSTSLCSLYSHTYFATTDIIGCQCALILLG